MRNCISECGLCNLFTVTQVGLFAKDGVKLHLNPRKTKYPFLYAKTCTVNPSY